MSEMGQGLFAQGFVRPSVPGISLPADVRAKMPDAPQIRPLDVVKAAARKADIDRDWAAAALARSAGPQPAGPLVQHTADPS